MEGPRKVPGGARRGHWDGESPSRGAWGGLGEGSLGGGSLAGTLWSHWRHWEEWGFPWWRVLGGSQGVAEGVGSVLGGEPEGSDCGGQWGGYWGVLGAEQSPGGGAQG